MHHLILAMHTHIHTMFLYSLLLLILYLHLLKILDKPLIDPFILSYHSQNAQIQTSHTIPDIKNNVSLDLYTMKELPDSYTWTKLEDPNPIDTTQRESIPVIDLENPNAQEMIGVACKSWGVFQVTNHGIGKRLLDNTEGACKSLFGLPAQRKLKAARLDNGFTGYGPARISSFFEKKLWSEGFTIFGSPLDHARLLWPNDYGKFCDIIEEYQKEMSKIAKKLTNLILASLGINVSTTNKCDEGAIGAIQLNSYPICPDPNRTMGLAPHTDSTLLTILYQNNISGLQIHRDGFGWVTVEPLQNGLVVNIGDLMQILSNGLYKSVYHRAMVNKVRHRYSVAYLYGPPLGARIGPMSELIGANHPPLYKEVDWSEYLGLKAKYFNNALSLARLNNNSYSNNNVGLNESENVNIDLGSKELVVIG